MKHIRIAPIPGQDTKAIAASESKKESVRCEGFFFWEEWNYCCYLPYRSSLKSAQGYHSKR